MSLRGRYSYGDRSTPKHYLNDLDLFIRQIGDKASEQITVRDIDDFIDNQVEKQLKPVTINRRIAPLHPTFA